MNGDEDMVLDQPQIIPEDDDEESDDDEDDEDHEN
jgi:hypothetical protein